MLIPFSLYLDMEQQGALPRQENQLHILAFDWFIKFQSLNTERTQKHKPEICPSPSVSSNPEYRPEKATQSHRLLPRNLIPCFLVIHKLSECKIFSQSTGNSRLKTINLLFG